MSAVRVNGEMSDWFSVNSGTGQGDIQGPPVFNFCLNFLGEPVDQVSNFEDDISSYYIHERAVFSTAGARSPVAIQNIESLIFVSPLIQPA